MRHVLFRLLLALLCSAVMMASEMAFAHEQRLPPGTFSPGRFPPGYFPPGSRPPGNFPPGSRPPGNFQQGSFIIVQTATSTVPGSTAMDLSVTCPAGRIATGGGGAIGTGVGPIGAGGAGGTGGIIGAGGTGGVFLSTTGPFPATTVNNPTGWHVIAENLSGFAQPITAWALCIRTS